MMCVISKNTFGDHKIRDIQTNNCWITNPYDDYAIVPEDMISALQETRGYCDIEFNAEGTEIISFTPREIPEV